MMIVLKFMKMNDSAILPSKKFDTDAGWDVHSLYDMVIEGGEQTIVHTGIQLAECPPQIVLQAWSRSGLDSKHGLHVGAGIIDSGYRGEILVLLKNTSKSKYTVRAGDKIAQLIPIHLPKVVVEETFELEESDRNEAGGITENVKELS